MGRNASGPSPSAQLGGSQAGVSLSYPVSAMARLDLVGTIAAPLTNRGLEGRVGLSWQPSGKIPVKLIAGGRIASKGAGHSGPEILATGGIGPRSIGAKFRLEAYGQAGAILSGQLEPYADGAVRVTRAARHLGKVKIEIGAGLWAGAQRGARRVDIGPSIVTEIPVRGHNLRLSLDWRQRIAGNAAPASGPAVTLISNF